VLASPAPWIEQLGELDALNLDLARPNVNNSTITCHDPSLLLGSLERFNVCTFPWGYRVQVRDSMLSGWFQRLRSKRPDVCKSSEYH
jgi:hypothetical protein